MEDCRKNLERNKKPIIFMCNILNELESCKKSQLLYMVKEKLLPAYIGSYRISIKVVSRCQRKYKVAHIFSSISHYLNFSCIQGINGRYNVYT